MTKGSLSARRAWIEIKRCLTRSCRATVALRKESVDRNVDVVPVQYRGQVALRKESVDRNTSLKSCRPTITVALRKESVDRNIRREMSLIRPYASLSARRAWIEISALGLPAPVSGSLSARRAWIEICCGAAVIAFLSGSLSARRAWIEMLGPACPGSMQSCRSPQGERG